MNGVSERNRVNWFVPSACTEQQPVRMLKQNGHSILLAYLLWFFSYCKTQIPCRLNRRASVYFFLPANGKAFSAQNGRHNELISRERWLIPFFFPTAQCFWLSYATKALYHFFYHVYTLHSQFRTATWKMSVSTNQSTEKSCFPA
jgi:hypothetical protein